MGSRRPGEKNEAMETSPVLYRPKDGAVLGGVCAGLGRRWSVDPNLLRIAVIVLSLAGGLGSVAYGAAWLLIPREGSLVVPIRSLLPFTRTWPLPALIAVVGGLGAVLVVALGGWSGVGFGPVLILGAIWYFVSFRGRGTAGPLPLAEPTPFDRAAEAWRRRLIDQRALTGSPGATVAVSALPRPLDVAWAPEQSDPEQSAATMPAVPARRHRRGWLWLVALALALLGHGVVALVESTGVPTSPVAYSAVVLAALGVTLVAATRVGRPPLMVAATVIAALSMALSMIPAGPGPGPSGVGEVNQSFTTAAELPAEVSVRLGEVTLDLGDMDLTADAGTTVQVGAGTATVILPDDVNSEVTWTVKAGEYRSAGQERSGIDLSGRDSFTPVAGGPTLRVDVSVEVGSLEVIR